MALPRSMSKAGRISTGRIISEKIDCQEDGILLKAVKLDITDRKART
jgi:hypothetical protein